MSDRNEAEGYCAEERLGSNQYNHVQRQQPVVDRPKQLRLLLIRDGVRLKTWNSAPDESEGGRLYLLPG
jgi:hypothetical protein